MTHYRIDARELRLEKTVSFWCGALFGVKLSILVAAALILLLRDNPPQARAWMSCCVFLGISALTLYLVIITRPNRGNPRRRTDSPWQFQPLSHFYDANT